MIEVDLAERLDYIVDSCPIILAKGPRSGHTRAALELCRKSYNSSRKEWYYGIKLYAIGFPDARPIILDISRKKGDNEKVLSETQQRA